MGKKGGGKKGKGSKVPKVLDPMQAALEAAPGPAPERKLEPGTMARRGDWWQSGYLGEAPPLQARARPEFYSSIDQVIHEEREALARSLQHSAASADDGDPREIDHVVLSVPPALRARLGKKQGTPLFTAGLTEAQRAPRTLELHDISSFTTVLELRCAAAEALDVPMARLRIELAGFSLGSDEATLGERHVINGGALELRLADGDDYTDEQGPAQVGGRGGADVGRYLVPRPPSGEPVSSPPPSPPSPPPAALSRSASGRQSQTARSLFPPSSSASLTRLPLEERELRALSETSFRLHDEWVREWQAAPVSEGCCACCKVAEAWSVLPGCRQDADGDGVWDDEEEEGERETHGHTAWCLECRKLLAKDVAYGDMRHARLVSLQHCALCKKEAAEAAEVEARAVAAKAQAEADAAAEAKVAAARLAEQLLAAPGEATAPAAHQSQA
jgi:hypothetical protein